RLPEQRPCLVAGERRRDRRGAGRHGCSFPDGSGSSDRTAAASSASASSTRRRAPPERSNGYAPPASSDAITDEIPAASSAPWAISASLRFGYAPTSTICLRSGRLGAGSRTARFVASVDALVEPLASAGG